MKKHMGIVLTVVVLCLCGCASISDSSNYNKLARERDFNYFFPSYSFYKYFATTEYAYNYIRTAQAKFATSSGKTLMAGRPGKLSGPPIVGQQPVTVFCTMWAMTNSTGIAKEVDLKTIDKPLEKVIGDNSYIYSASVQFWVFYDDRGIFEICHYLDTTRYSGYSLSREDEYYNFSGQRYDANRPLGWNTEKAFQYLRKEIN